MKHGCQHYKKDMQQAKVSARCIQWFYKQGTPKSALFSSCSVTAIDKWTHTHKRKLCFIPIARGGKPRDVKELKAMWMLLLASILVDIQVTVHQWETHKDMGQQSGGAPPHTWMGDSRTWVSSQMEHHHTCDGMKSKVSSAGRLQKSYCHSWKSHHQAHNAKIFTS